MDAIGAFILILALGLVLPFYELYAAVTGDPLNFLAHIFIAILAVVAAFFFILAILLSGKKD